MLVILAPRGTKLLAVAWSSAGIGFPKMRMHSAWVVNWLLVCLMPAHPVNRAVEVISRIALFIALVWVGEIAAIFNLFQREEIPIREALTKPWPVDAGNFGPKIVVKVFLNNT